VFPRRPSGSVDASRYLCIRDDTSGRYSCRVGTEFGAWREVPGGIVPVATATGLRVQSYCRLDTVERSLVTVKQVRRVREFHARRVAASGRPHEYGRERTRHGRIKALLSPMAGGEGRWQAKPGVVVITPAGASAYALAAG